MNVKNSSKRLICLQTSGGRVDLLPGKTTEDKRIESVKGEKVFKALVKSGDLEIVKASKSDKKNDDEGGKKTEKDLLIEEAQSMNIDTTDMTIAKLKDAIKEAKEGEQ